MNRVLFIPGLMLGIAFINYLGFVSPPNSILFSPIVIIAIMVVSLTIHEINILARILLSVSLIIVNDILIRTYAGGTHDSEGNAWIIFMFLLGVIPALGILILYLLRTNQSLRKSILSTLLGISVIAIYYHFFSTYGMKWIERESTTQQESQESQKFLGEIDIEGNLNIETAWYEKSIKIDHTRLIKTRNEVENYIYIVQLAPNEFDSNKRYRVSTSTGYFLLNDRIEFSAKRGLKEFQIIITEAENTKNIIDTVIIKRP